VRKRAFRVAESAGKRGKLPSYRNNSAEAGNYALRLLFCKKYLKRGIITLTKQPLELEAAPSLPESGAGAPDDGITVSREMRDAGEAVFDEFFGSYPTSLLVEAVYRAMRSLA
jgi:hypothetical protein